MTSTASALLRPDVTGRAARSSADDEPTCGRARSSRKGGIVRTSPPKAHLPGTGAPCPQPGEGGSPFEPGRVREAHGAAGAVGASASSPRWWRRVAAGLRHAVADERGDVPGWVLISIMTAGIVMVLWATAGELLVQVFQNAIDRVAAFG